MQIELASKKTSPENDDILNDKFTSNKKKFVPKKSSFEWRPVPTIRSTTLCFFIFGTIFIAIGGILLYLSQQIKEFVLRYDNLNNCDLTNNNFTSHECNISISIEERFDPPIMVYYQLENFYQDHRRYIKSKSLTQLKGEDLKLADIQSDCDPIVTVKDLGFYKTIGNYSLAPTDVANPCGLIAKSLFNDTYKLFNISDKEYLIDETNIAWDSDKKGRFKRHVNASLVQWTDIENEHFMVWMRPAGLPDFRKLWGRIKTQINPGKYSLVINNNFPVDSFQGKKSFVLSTVNMLGGKNNFLGIAYLIVGFICWIMALLFYVGYYHYNSEKKKNN